MNPSAGAKARVAEPPAVLANAPPAVKLLAAVQVTPVVTSGVVPLRAPLPSKLSEKMSSARNGALVSTARVRKNAVLFIWKDG